MSCYYDQGDYILDMTFSGTVVFCKHETEKVFQHLSLVAKACMLCQGATKPYRAKTGKLAKYYKEIEIALLLHLTEL